MRPHHGQMYLSPGLGRWVLSTEKPGKGQPTNNMFAGVKCNSICSVGRYGEGCNSLCYCDNGSCDPHTGQCLCTRGFTGPKCDIPCSPGFYGVNCRQACPPCNSSKFYLSVSVQNGLFVMSWWLSVLSCKTWKLSKFLYQTEPHSGFPHHTSSTTSPPSWLKYFTKW